MTTTRERIEQYLSPLLGLTLSIARRAAGMRNLQFGQVMEDETGSWGEYALHIQCPWRVEFERRVLTGLDDLWEPADPDEDIDRQTWRYDTHPNLQDRIMGALLGGYDPRTRSHVNASERLIVEQVEADDFGGITLSLSGGFRIVLFPTASREESWRMFSHATDDPHLVVAGGRITSAPDLPR